MNDSDEAVTLYNRFDGSKVVSHSRAEIVRLRATGYSDKQPFTPDEHTVDDVQAHLRDHPEDAPRVVAVERAGKRRSTILGTETDSGPGDTVGTPTD